MGSLMPWVWKSVAHVVKNIMKKSLEDPKMKDLLKKSLQDRAKKTTRTQEKKEANPVLEVTVRVCGPGSSINHGHGLS